MTYIVCIEEAEWELVEVEVYKITYSCTKHLSNMVSDDTTHITPYTNGDQICHCIEED